MLTETSLLETTHNHRIHTTISFTSSQDFKRTHEEFFFKNLKNPSDDHALIGETSFLAAREGTTPPSRKEPVASSGKMVVEERGRERLKRHRVEMSGRVWIPDIWGHEDRLKSWIDCTVFDSCLEKSNIMSAREALIQEGRSTLRIENSC
ncbi:hypothetical protein L1987_41159 [Smallanthus sonchifolius]|uniref:Uncharacterized protein n=1 Tax=Smallanthus sonchifolius TaxID=185202 RepID=A0ACB9GUX0_9ASTR|nr:hypothetical protein L1987_41159 [Smallanthus sonchifolius]